MKQNIDIALGSLKSICKAKGSDPFFKELIFVLKRIQMGGGTISLGGFEREI